MMDRLINSRFVRRIKGIMFKYMHNMITCREFEGFILSYLDDELPQKQRSIFEFHMRICRECRQYLEAYKRSLELGCAVFTKPEAPLPDDVPEDLIKAVIEAIDHKS